MQQHGGYPTQVPLFLSALHPNQVTPNPDVIPQPVQGYAVQGTAVNFVNPGVYPNQVLEPNPIQGFVFPDEKPPPAYEASIASAPQQYQNL